MPASTDLYAWAAVALVALATHLAIRNSGRAHRAAATQALAERSGHPSAGLAQHLTWNERLHAAADAADRLAEAGLICTRLSAQPVVRARGLDGEYVLNVGPTRVVVAYATNTAHVSLGRFPAIYQAVRSITLHAGIPAPR